MTDTSWRWHLVVPLKPLTEAKTRLTAQPSIRRTLVRAFARDVVAACVAGAPNQDIAVVGDASWAEEVPPSVRLCPDEGPDLNGALRKVVAALPSTDPVAIILGDLPCVTADDIRRLLRVAGELLATHSSVVVPDAAGTGTAVLVSRAGEMSPSFGPHSRRSHRTAGSVELDSVAWSRVRCDVDDVADLSRARSLGLGPNTSRALEDSGLLTREEGPIVMMDPSS